MALDTILFPKPKPAPIHPEFLTRLRDGIDLAQGLNMEKGRSEFIIGPFLLELRRMAPKQFGLFSGTEFNVDQTRGLNGYIDFMITPLSRTYLLTPPVLIIVEAKNDNVWNGFGQCIATMVAAAEYNRRTGLEDSIYGISTTGMDWKFLRLDGTEVTIDREGFFINQPELLAGILLDIVSSRQAQMAVAS
ncbi:MAG: hypothetical protein LC104_00340 [Bacteroidales bacterium]|nr:hypothetical protein [Bacteroidales bacterium]